MTKYFGLWTEPFNGELRHDRGPNGWLNPTRHKLEGEKTQQWTQYLTWFSQEYLHPRGGGFSLNKWEEIHSNASIAFTKSWIRGARAPFFSSSSLSLSFFLSFSLVCRVPPSFFSFLFYSIAPSLHGPVWVSSNGPVWAWLCIGLSLLFFLAPHYVCHFFSSWR